MIVVWLGPATMLAVGASAATAAGKLADFVTISPAQGPGGEGGKRQQWELGGSLVCPWQHVGQVGVLGLQQPRAHRG
jgi:hypothetical protein